MDEIRDAASGPIGDSDVEIKASVFDWDGLEESTFSGYTNIVHSAFHIMFLGGTVRTFKPGTPLVAHVSPKWYHSWYIISFLPQCLI